MKKNNYACPHCGNKIDFGYTFITGIFAKFKCKECGSTLRPDKNKILIITFLTSLFTFFSSYLGIEIAHEFGKIYGEIVIIVGGLVGFFLATIACYFNVPFKVVKKSEDLYFKGGILRKALHADTNINSADFKLGEVEKVKEKISILKKKG